MTEVGDDLSSKLSEQVKNAILSALHARYISISSHMDYPTGNAYQALSLGDEAVGGYRQDRSKLFGVFDFSGRRVLDCGCNLGKLSRLARDRGAVLVDGIEYDNYFVQIARLINTYKGTTRVSFFQGDLTDPSVINDTYDVTMAFSVFPYVLPVMDKIAAATSEALVLETHKIDAEVLSSVAAPKCIQ
jgi:SAM-dependent methyltransferase